MNAAAGRSLAFTGRLRASLARLAWLAALACAVSALSLRLADLWREPARLDVDQAALPEPRPEALSPPSFESLRYAGITAFSYTQRTDQPHSFEVKKAPQAAPAAPEPEPDVSGLRLVATLTATDSARAILEQAGTSGQTVVSLGAPFRDAFVSGIGPSGIELTRGGKTVFVPLWTPWNASQPQPAAMLDGKGRIHRVSAPVTGAPASKSVAARREGNRHHLGVAVRSLTDAEAKAAGLPAGTGLLVTGVTRAGIDIREDDILATLDGRPIVSIAMVLDALRLPDKTALRFGLIRGGARSESNVPLFD